MNSRRVVIPMLQYYPDRPSGSTRLAFEEATYLARQGHEVWVVAPDLSGKKPEYCFQDGLHVLRYVNPVLGLFDPRRWNMHQEATARVLQRYVGQDVDVVHGHSLLHYKGALDVYGARCRVGYSIHSPVRLEMLASARNAPWLQRSQLQLKALLTHRIERNCLECSNYVTADSQYTKTLLGTLHGADVQRKVHVIPGWVDLEKFQVIADREAAKIRLGWPTDVPLLFTLRRLVPRMGLDLLLYALQEIKSLVRFHLVIGGQGPLRETLESLVDDLGLRERVHFAGFVPETLLPIMYGAADAFVLPTAKLECFGLIALESLASGRPVLATPVGAIPELVQQVEPAWLSSDVTPETIAHLLRDFLHGKLPEHNPQQLRAFVTDNYAADSVLEKLTSTALGLSNEE